MDYRKKARELANLLGRTSVDYHNKSIAVDFIETALKEAVSEVKNLAMPNVIVPKGTVCELTEWDSGDETNLCDCGKGEGNCKKQTAL